MEWLVIITASTGGQLVQRKWVQRFDLGTARSYIYDWACQAVGIPLNGSCYDVAVLFFYAEPEQP